MTPYYTEDGITIYHGDCAETMWDLGAEWAAAAVFSPPYNVGIAYDGYDDARAWTAYGTDVSEWSEQTARALTTSGRCWVNVAPVVQEEPGGAGRNGHHSGRSTKTRQNLIYMWSFALAEHGGLSPADIIAWCSQRGSGTAWGSYEMPTAPNIRGDWEAILVYYKRSWSRVAPAGMEGWRDTLGGWPELVSNVWTIRPEQRNGHPAPYPVQLAERCIRLSTWPGEVVLDPFCGEGSTLVAAKRLGRRAVGIEQSERYCEMAANRLSQGLLFSDGAA